LCRKTCAIAITRLVTLPFRSQILFFNPPAFCSNNRGVAAPRRTPAWTAVVVLKPDHVRDVDLFVNRYHARAFGPRLFFRYDIPKNELEWIEPGSQLPGGIVALYDGRGRDETPLWLPEQRALVFADALTAPGGELRAWAPPWHPERALPQSSVRARDRLTW